MMPKVKSSPGIISGLFLIGYAGFRGLVELVRQPDAQIGVLQFGLTMGQTLSIPMVLVGGFLIWRALNLKAEV